MEERMKVGQWGGKAGSYWSFKANKGGISEIIIIHGEAIDSISFKSEDGAGAFEYSDKYGGDGGDRTDKLDNKMSVVVPRGPGPWGGHGGKQWDDGVFSAIRELHLHVGDSVIHAIHVMYESRDGKLVWSPKHGGSGGDKIYRIKLDESRDFLVGIVGFYGPVKGDDSFEALRSITFYTSNGKYGPFGYEIGNAFTSSVSTGKVVGFHGRSGVYLDAIGVHTEYF